LRPQASGSRHSGEHIGNMQANYSGEPSFRKPVTSPLSARDMVPVLILLAAMFGLGRFLQHLGREYIIVFSANVSMITLFLTAVIFRRTKDWRIVPLMLLFLGMALQLSMAIAIEVRGWPAPQVSLWLMANPLFVPTLLGFATVLYLWRVLQAQAEMAQREDYMARKLQLAQKYESLGSMAGGIAHDFNNLLTTILGNVALARYDLEATSDVAECLDSIENAADRAARITKQMLDFSGHGEFTVETFDLNRLIIDLEELITSFLPKTTTVNYQLDENRPQIRGDKTQVGQVILNLVTNAAEAAHSKPAEITIGVHKTTADDPLPANELPGTPTNKTGNYFALRVTDNGNGIPSDVRTRLFDPFVTTKETGRGMGLPAALGIVHGHHGTIAVEKTGPDGTTITVLLPECGPKEEPQLRQ